MTPLKIFLLMLVLTYIMYLLDKGTESKHPDNEFKKFNDVVGIIGGILACLYVPVMIWMIFHYIKI